MIKRFVYIIYYLIKLDRNKFSSFLAFASKKSKKSKFNLITDMILSVFKYNISLLEYFQFHFYEKNGEERKKWAGTGYMYEYQLLMNPKKYREILENKIMFLKKYSDFVNHVYLTSEQIKNKADITKIINNPTGKIVFKHSKGQCGKGILIKETAGVDRAVLLNELKNSGNDFVESFVQQHDELDALSSSGLNTIRIITQLDNDNHVYILGARLRITINSIVDNLAAGNIAAPINLETGIVEGPGVFSDITKNDLDIHPITGTKITGFKIPFWSETLSLVKNAALIDTNNKSIGWDIAITNDGPELIEGNHDWCKLLWQLPVKKGLKPVLEKFRSQSQKL
jgi:hypothetical protein